MQSSIPLTRILLVAGLLLASVRSVQAADITWTGVTGGGDGTSWHDVNNWDLLRVPTNDDVVIIPDVAGTTEVHYSAAAGTTSIDSMTCDEPFRLSGGTLEIDSLEIDSASFANSTYTQTGGTLEGSGDLTVTGSLTWSGGTMAGAGKTIANGDMLLNISGQVELRRNLDNAATATWASGSLLIGSAGVFTNTGIFDAQGNNSIGLTGPPGTFDNQGTFRKSAGGGTTNVEVVFDNSDTVDVQDGTLNLSGGGNHTDSIIMGDATLEFSGDFGVGITNDLDLNTTVSVANLVVTHATMNLAGTYEPTGPTISTWVNGSAVANFTGPIPGSVGDLTISNESTANVSPPGGTLTASTYTQTGGWLEGSGDLNVTGQLIWLNGGMRGAGTTLANGDIQLSGGALQRHLVSAGTTTWTNGSFGINSPGVWSNMPGAHFDAQSSGPSNATLGGSGGRFDNRGTFQKSTTGTTKVEVPFNNTGTVDVQDGLLQMTRGGTHTDAIITGTGTLEFGGNFGVGITYELVGATLVRVANLVVTHAIMNLAGTYEPTGPTIST
ncbi:MAG: hypothetical protein GY778_12770, partial [bacterium]|nr:hypothetical protein [bacterium]